MAEFSLRLSVVYREPELLRSTLENYLGEFENATDACWFCDAEYLCSKHRALLNEIVDDAAALAIGMADLRID